MNDTLRYTAPLVSRIKPDQQTQLHFHFSMLNGEFYFAFSHDEVVHGKKSLLNKYREIIGVNSANLRFRLALAIQARNWLFMAVSLGSLMNGRLQGAAQLDWGLTAEFRKSIAK